MGGGVMVLGRSPVRLRSDTGSSALWPSSAASSTEPADELTVSDLKAAPWSGLVLMNRSCDLCCYSLRPVQAHMCRILGQSGPSVHSRLKRGA